MSHNYQHYHDRAKRIEELSNSDPQAAVHHLDDISELLRVGDVSIRRLAAKAVLNLSQSVPLEIRDHIDGFMTRLDDVDMDIRHSMLLAMANVSHWYPQDLTSATEVMVDALQATNEHEQLAAARAVSQIAYYRPDIVTPRQEALEGLKALSELTSVRASEGVEYAEPQVVEEAIRALEGGDMASRPLEDDLPPVGDSSRLSSPAWAGVSAILWMPAMVLACYSVLWHSFKMSYKYRYYSTSAKMRVTLSEFKKLRFFVHWRRARLYMRSSIYPTTASFVPIQNIKTPIDEDPSADVPPRPEDWRQIRNCVAARDGYECRVCGALGGERGETILDVDHKVPRSVGGDDHPHNLRTLCRDCHQARHARLF